MKVALWGELAQAWVSHHICNACLSALRCVSSSCVFAWYTHLVDEWRIFTEQMTLLQIRSTGFSSHLGRAFQIKGLTDHELGSSALAVTKVLAYNCSVQLSSPEVWRLDKSGPGEELEVNSPSQTLSPSLSLSSCMTIWVAWTKTFSKDTTS